MALLTLAAVAATCAVETETTLSPITAVGPTTTTASSSPAVAPKAAVTTTAPTTTATPQTPVLDDRTEERMTMVDQQIVERGVEDALVIAAMREVPRHRFVPDQYAALAYGDHPLPIGYGQTISQPVIVALMSTALQLAPGDKVLEIGTGSGYQAAVLAAMGMEVYSVEIIPELAASAQTVLADLEYGVAVLTADGYHGWEEHAPYDGIVVTAAPDHVPQPLVEQLAPDAALVIPVGPIGAVQTLWRFTLDARGEVIGESLEQVAFVPLTRAGED